MIWALLSILAGLGDAFSFVMIKKLSSFDAYLTLLLRNLVALPFILLAFFFYGFSIFSMNFYIIAFVVFVFFTAASFLMIKSIQMSGLSATLPMLSFTPIFLLVASYIFLREFPTFLGGVGIFLIVIGSYIVNISSVKYGYLEPFKSIFKDKGVFYMFIVAVLFSITASLGKIAINLSNPAYYTFIIYILVSFFLTILFYRKFKDTNTIKKNFVHIILLGFSTAMMEIFGAVAVKYAIISYVISLKRSSVLFGVLLGFLLFKEKNFKEALIGSLIMFIGIILITIS